MNISLQQLEPKYFFDIPEVDISVHDKLSFPEELVLFNENLIPIGYIRTLIEQHGDRYSVNVKSEGCDDSKSLERETLKFGDDILEILQCESISSDKKNEQKEDKSLTVNKKCSGNVGSKSQEIKMNNVLHRGIFGLIKPCKKGLPKKKKVKLPLHPCQLKFNEKYEKEIMEFLRYRAESEETSFKEESEKVSVMDKVEEVSSVEQESLERSEPEETLIFANLSRGMKYIHKPKPDKGLGYETKVTKKMLGKLFGIKGEIVYNEPVEDSENETSYQQYARCPHIHSVCYKGIHRKRKKYKPHVCLTKRSTLKKSCSQSFKRIRISYDLKRMRPRQIPFIKIKELADIDVVRNNLSKIQQEIYELRKQTFAIQENTLQLQEPKLQRQKPSYQFEEQVKEFKERISKVLSITQKYRLKADSLKTKVKELQEQVNGLIDLPLSLQNINPLLSSKSIKQPKLPSNDELNSPHQEEVQFHLEEVRNHLGQARGNIGDAQGHLWMTDDNLENIKKIKRIKISPLKLQRRQLQSIREAQFHLNKTQLQLNKAYDNLGDAGDHVEKIKKHKIEYISALTVSDKSDSALKPKFQVSQGILEKGKVYFQTENEILQDRNINTGESSAINTLEQLVTDKHLADSQDRQGMQEQNGSIKRSYSKSTIKGKDQILVEKKDKKPEEYKVEGEIFTGSRTQSKGGKKSVGIFQEQLYNLDEPQDHADDQYSEYLKSSGKSHHTRLQSHIVFSDDEDQFDDNDFISTKLKNQREYDWKDGIWRIPGQEELIETQESVTRERKLKDYSESSYQKESAKVYIPQPQAQAFNQNQDFGNQKKELINNERNGRVKDIKKKSDGENLQLQSMSRVSFFEDFSPKHVILDQKNSADEFGSKGKNSDKHSEFPYKQPDLLVQSEHEKSDCKWPPVTTQSTSDSASQSSVSFKLWLKKQPGEDMLSKSSKSKNEKSDTFMNWKQQDGEESSNYVINSEYGTSKFSEQTYFPLESISAGFKGSQSFKDSQGLKEPHGFKESRSSTQFKNASAPELGYYTLMTLTGEVTFNYTTLREKRNEIEEQTNKKCHRSFHMAHIRNTHFYTYTDDNYIQPTAVHTFPADIMKNIITESANILLLRKLATSTFRGKFKTNSLLINGKICESTYEVGPRHIKMFNNCPVILVKVIRTITFPNGTSSKAYSILTNKGRMVKAWWNDSGYKLIVKSKHFANEDSFCCYRPIPVEEYLKNEELRQMFFKKIKKNTDTSSRYLHNHPEVMIMLHRYLRNVLLTKPRNVLSYTVCYFSGQPDLIKDVKKYELFFYCHEYNYIWLGGMFRK